MRFISWGVCFVLALACLLASVPATTSYGKQKAILLKDVQSLVFTKDAFTQSRRSSPIPQMTCIKGPCQYAASTAFCKNIGFDGIDVNWQCEAELPKGVKLTSATVSCEGFAHSDDPYVLAGSCGLEYSLEGAPLFIEEKRAPLPAQNTWWHPIHKAAGSLWNSSPVSWVWNEWNKHRGVGVNAHHPHGHHYDSYDRYEERLSLLPSLGSFVSFGIVAAVLYIIYKSLFPSVYMPNHYQQRRVSWPLSTIYDMMSFNSVQPPPYSKNDQSANYIPTSSSSSSSGLVHGVLGLLGGYMLGSRRGQANSAAPPAAWNNFHDSHVAREAGYDYSSRNLNRFPQMSVNESPAAPVRVNEAVAPGEKIVAERSVREDEAITRAEIPTTETSKAFGTTKRR